MLVATWNVNGIRARLHRLLEWLDDRQPEIVCLQELKADDNNFPADDIERAGYTAVASCQKGWNGVAVLAKGTGAGAAGLIDNELPGEKDFGARLVSAEVGPLTVVSVYVPNGKDIGHDDFPAKLRWLDHLAKYLEATAGPGQTTIVGGDFNLVPADIDSYDSKGLAGTIFHTPQERAAYRQLLDAGFVDLFRDCEPELPGFSWWDYRGGNFHKNLGLRIDLLLATPPLAEKALKVWIDRDFRKGSKPSDHAPVMAQLDI